MTRNSTNQATILLGSKDDHGRVSTPAKKAKLYNDLTKLIMNEYPGDGASESDLKVYYQVKKVKDDIKSITGDANEDWLVDAMFVRIWRQPDQASQNPTKVLMYAKKDVIDQVRLEREASHALVEALTWSSTTHRTLYDDMIDDYRQGIAMDLASKAFRRADQRSKFNDVLMANVDGVEPKQANRNLKRIEETLAKWIESNPEYVKALRDDFKQFLSEVKDSQENEITQDFTFFI